METTELKDFTVNFDIVDNALQMRYLQRWNGRNLFRTENLSEHTHLVCACAIEEYDYFKNAVPLNFEEILRCCMLHDSLELLRGDILSVTKDYIPGLREFTDDEEKQFIENKLGRHISKGTEIIVKLADLKACYKFIEELLKYPANDFAYEAYVTTKKRYVDLLLKTCSDFGVPVVNIQSTPKFQKGYEQDAGSDIILYKAVELLPKQTTTVDLKLSIDIKDDEAGLILPRSSASKRGLFLTTSPIDPGYKGTIHAIVYNSSNNIITYQPGESFCQLMIVKTTKTPGEARKQGKRTDNNFGSTGR